MFNKAIQELVKIAPKGSIRPTLAGLYFKGNKIAVTDSFRFMEVSVNNFKTEELPIPTNEIKYLKSDEIDFMIPSESIKDIKIPKNKNISVLNNAYFCNLNKKHGEVINVGIITNDLEKEVVTQTRVLQGRFPDYESFLENDGVLEIGVNPDYLMELCETFKKLGYTSIKLKLGTPLQPIVMEGAETEDYKSAKAVLMPLKI